MGVIQKLILNSLHSIPISIASIKMGAIFLSKNQRLALGKDLLMIAFISARHEVQSSQQSTNKHLLLLL